jgi:hypothetical protein
VAHGYDEHGQQRSRCAGTPSLANVAAGIGGNLNVSA